MPRHADTLRQLLAAGPLTPRQLIEKMGISQPTLSREMVGLGDEVLRIGAGRSIQYARRDRYRGFDDIPVYQIDDAGRISPFGRLIPTAPDGYVLQPADGPAQYSDGLPWWLFDLRPQGYLGRAYAASHAVALGLPTRLQDWNDSHVLRALLAHGHDAPGNWLLGNVAREHFLSAPLPCPIAIAEKAERYRQLAAAAALGEVPGSSAGGEQAKFTSYVDTDDGPQHVLVKFSLPEDNPVTERWRDLLLAEHLALETLSVTTLAAARTRLLEHGCSSTAASAFWRSSVLTGWANSAGAACFRWRRSMRNLSVPDPAAGRCWPSVSPLRGRSARRPRARLPCCTPLAA